MVEELEPGIGRVTFRLPFGIDHVHCYLLRSSTGGFVLVDTGLGSRDPEARWRPVLDALDAPIEAIVVTHLHPDHVGGARDVAGLTGAPVHQGREDFAQCELVWGRANGELLRAYWLAQGIPPETTDGHRRGLGPAARGGALAARARACSTPGDEVDGWRVEVLRGHADGHIVLVRDGVLIAGDTLLTGSRRRSGSIPTARPDPLGDYFETLARIEELAPRVAYAGHRDADRRSGGARAGDPRPSRGPPRPHARLRSPTVR